MPPSLLGFRPCPSAPCSFTAPDATSRLLLPVSLLSEALERGCACPEHVRSQLMPVVNSEASLVSQVTLCCRWSFCASRPLSPSAGPQVPQEGLPGDVLRSVLLCTQPQTLGQSVLQAEMDYDLHSSLQVCEHLAGGVWDGRAWFPAAVTLPHLASQSVCPLQPLLFPMDTSCGGMYWHRSVSPSSLLDTAISEEVRPGPGLDEEQEVQEPLPSSTGRRHTLAEVSTCFSPGAPPCKCPRGPHAHLTGGFRGGAAPSDDSAPDLPFLYHLRPYGPYLDLTGSSRASGLEGNLPVLGGWQGSSLAQARLSRVQASLSAVVTLQAPQCWLPGLPGLW